MKRNLARRSLVALLLALHATLSLCGPGHHAALAASRDSKRVDDPALGLSPAADAHCPVCEYLSAVVPPSAWASPALHRRVEPAGPRLDVAPPPCPPLHLSRPRAPPAGAAT